MRRELDLSGIASMLAIALLVGGSVFADEDKSSQQKNKGSTEVEKQTPQPTPPPSNASSSEPIVYVRPQGAPGGREGGGTRGGAAMDLVALLPEDHAALTTREQPTLYWYVAEPTAARVDVVVSRGQDEKPLLEKTLAGPFSAGVHAVKFSDFGVKLEPDVLYKWYVEVISDPLRRSQDSLSGGTILRVTPSPALAAALVQSKPSERAAVFARNGIWCDALAELSMQLAATPNDPELQREQTSLLSQVGLAAVAGVSYPQKEKMP